MRPTILLIGKSGQIGSKLHELLPEIGQLFAPELGELDLSNPDSVRRVIRDTHPHLIVNAAAYTAVDAAENDAPGAYMINAKAPALLAEEAKRLDAFLVHYSTDYVFDGLKRSPYMESDPTNPLNVYGKSKLAGEDGIRASGTMHLIFRTSWVYSTRGQNFLLTILRLATEREELRIVCDQIGAPTCADDVAEATTKILAAIYRKDEDFRSVISLKGTYNMTAAGETNWYEFTKAILEGVPSIPPRVSWFAAATRSRPLIAKRVVPISAKEFRSSTLRPSYSVLSNSLLMQTFHVVLPDWTAQLQRCLATEDKEDVPLADDSPHAGPSIAPTS